MKTPDPLSAAIDSVVNNDNCSGCGACALISDRVTMQMSSSGYMRPVIGPGASRSSDAELLQASCPGLTVQASREAPHFHVVFGAYYSVWVGRAIDEETAHAGSSAGVITALTTATTARGGSGVGVRADAANPSRTVSVTITTREEALRSAGSRYAPVSAVSQAGGITKDDIFVGKPCEVGALRGLSGADGRELPLLVSFFCAGTPSQLATDKLVSERLEMNLGGLSDLRYRGNGWPGSFSATSTEGMTAEISYRESWGQVLGKSLQWRCKICPDGTARLSDISVGDYWASDDKGFPILEGAAEGRSVIVCRTERGHSALRAAVQMGIVEAESLDLRKVEPVQPLQMDRGITMMGRLIGTRAAGRAVPRFRGFNTILLFLRHPVRNARAAAGTYLRVKGRRR